MADALAAELLFSRDAECLQRRARGDHDRSSPYIRPLRGGHTPGSVFVVQRCRLAGGELRAGPHRLLLNDRAQVIARDAVGEPGIALDPFDSPPVTAE